MINVIGLGYIGLPTALMLAAHGVEVVGTDCDKNLVEKLARGELTFEEKGLDEIFEKAKKSGVKFTDTYQVADTYIVSVPTPYDSLTKKIDVSYVETAVKNVLKVCPDKATIVIESTVSPGTIEKTIKPIIDSYCIENG